MSDTKCKSRDESGVVVTITEEWHVGKSQRAVKMLALSIGLSQVSIYSLATSVSELANNLFFHTNYGGTITLKVVRKNGRAGIEIAAADKGPGIADLDSAMLDSFTTNGGLGGGLPGVERLMDEFEITSKIGVGTWVVARKWEKCS